MTEASREGEQSAEQLWDLAPISERSKGGGKDGDDPKAKFYAVGELDAEYRPRM